jgi:hypothetical protein
MSSSEHPEWEIECLKQLDRHAKAYDFPVLNNVYFHNADVRLNVFRNDSEWLIVFQEIALSQKHGFVDSVSAYGNKLQKTGTLLGVRITQTDKYTNVSNAGSFSLVINGKDHHFAPSEEDYRKAQVGPDAVMPEGAKLLRLLAFLMPDELFLNDGRLLEICGRKSAALEKFMQLDDWQHPDVAIDELPSQSPCLRSLAKALAIGDVNLYECPAKIWNTHWSNWTHE